MLPGTIGQDRTNTHPTPMGYKLSDWEYQLLPTDCNKLIESRNLAQWMTFNKIPDNEIQLECQLLKLAKIPGKWRIALLRIWGVRLRQPYKPWLQLLQSMDFHDDLGAMTGHHHHRRDAGQRMKTITLLPDESEKCQQISQLQIAGIS